MSYRPHRITLPNRILPALIALPIMVSCTSGPNADEWIYAQDKLTPASKQSKFKQHNTVCQKNYRTAQALVKSRELRSSPDAAYEFCMRSRGWKPVQED